MAVMPLARRVRLLPILALMVSCGDDTPTSPTLPSRSTTSPGTSSTPNLLSTGTLPAGTVLRIVSGAGGAPVAAAQVKVEGTLYETDENGSVTLSSGVGRDTRLDIIAEGFLDRRTLLGMPDTTRLTLWPRDHANSLNEEFTRAIVYGNGDGTVRGMIRIPLGESAAYVVPSSQIRADLRAMRAVNAAADNIGKATRGELLFVVTDNPPPGAVVFDMVVDPNDPDMVGAAAIAKRRFQGFGIVGGTAIFDSIERVRTSTTPHELGHMFGLGHSDGTKDIMNTFRRRGTVERFSGREELTMRLMLQRLPRNEFPDNDRNVRTPSSLMAGEGWVSVVRCQY